MCSMPGFVTDAANIPECLTLPGVRNVKYVPTPPTPQEAIAYCRHKNRPLPSVQQLEQLAQLTMQQAGHHHHQQQQQPQPQPPPVPPLALQQPQQWQQPVLTWQLPATQWRINGPALPGAVQPRQPIVGVPAATQITPWHQAPPQAAVPGQQQYFQLPPVAMHLAGGAGGVPQAMLSAAGRPQQQPPQQQQQQQQAMYYQQQPAIPQAYYQAQHGPLQQLPFPGQQGFVPRHPKAFRDA